VANKLVITNSSDHSLVHYGIRGQKWGLRRFQNADGTRTRAGKKRHGDAPEAVKEKQKQRSEDHTQSRVNKKKGIDSLSNDELRKLNERLQLEEAYKRLTPEKIAKGENWLKDAIVAAGKDTVKDVAKGVMLGGAKLLIKQISPQIAAAGFKMKEEAKT
jgi:hypothetical protein